MGRRCVPTSKDRRLTELKQEEQSRSGDDQHMQPAEQPLSGTSAVMRGFEVEPTVKAVRQGWD